MRHSAENRHMILCVGLTPTVQRTLFFDQFALGSVNRASKCLITASGKGVNVARVATTLGGTVQLLQPLGGETGKFVAKCLRADKVDTETIWLSDDIPTRTCTTLIAKDAPTTTELVEEALPIDSKSLEHLSNALIARLWVAKMLCISGSLPPGIPENFYATLTKWAGEVGIPVVIDAQKAPLRLALEQKPWLVKPNLEEAFTMLGLTRTDDIWNDAWTATAHLRELGAQNALVTMGSHGAFLYTKEGKKHQFTPPAIEAINPIGSGDALTGGLVYACAEEKAGLVESVAVGMACAAANCLTETSGVIDPTLVPRYFKEVLVR
jgi:tagatose 6-phosphate kinase